MSLTGAGVLVVAQTTGRVLLQKRSNSGSEVGTWACFGGLLKARETPREGALRELREETGFAGGFLRYRKIYEYRAGDFVYHNFLMVVPSEFEPRLNAESDAAAWSPTIGTALPRRRQTGAALLPLHFGLEALVQDAAASAAIREAMSVRGRKMVTALFERQRSV